MTSSERGLRHEAKITLTHMLRQPSSYASGVSLLDQHFSLVVDQMFAQVEWPKRSSRISLLRSVAFLSIHAPAQRKHLWSLCLFHAVSCHQDVLSGLFLNRLDKSEWTVAAFRLFPLLDPPAPPLASLFPLGLYLIDETLSPSGKNAAALTLLDRFLGWCGDHFHAPLTQERLALLLSVSGGGAHALQAWTRRQALLGVSRSS